MRKNSARTARVLATDNAHSSLPTSTYTAESTPKMQGGAPRQTRNVATGQRHSAIFEKTSLRGAPRVHKS